MRLTTQALLSNAYGGFSEDPAIAPFMPVERKIVEAPQGTIISLGSLLNGPAAPKREFSRVLESAQMNQVFLKDYEQVWYQRGLLGITENRAETVTWMGDFLKDMPRPWHFIGASAGGYMALYLGHQLKADGIVTFGAQTLVNRRSVVKFAGQKPWEIGFDLNDPSNDLLPLLRDEPFAGKAELHYAEHNPFDTQQMQRVEDCSNVMLVPHDYKRHPVAFHLREIGELSNVLNRAFGVDTPTSTQANAQ
ncbi:hypothetical protein [Pacificibacter marinus]|nr:hypothetical protein [Pacificibacter marinus]